MSGHASIRRAGPVLARSAGAARGTASTDPPPARGTEGSHR
ncbi:hypothetical protein Q6350_06065 [Isoptericola sp. b515]|nr:hypothetical protein [Isoptericola sp. b515]MDO8147992.1 hypothetical protein [Isoptericola sp. b515]